MPPKKKPTFNVVPKGTFDLRRLQLEADKKEKDAKNKIDLKKRKFIVRKNMAEVKKKQQKFNVKKPKKQQKFNVVKNRSK